MSHSIIHIHNLTKRYQPKKDVSELYALKDINLSVEEGDIFGIIGMSGAGKSTLIRCINGLEKPTDGKVFLEDDEITGLSDEMLREVRRKMGMIFQHFNLFSSRTSLGNVLYPMEISNKISREYAQELLSLVGLKGKEHFYPSQLSGGEKQRVAIARALANHPKILLCDEATSSLDPRTTNSILELLSGLNKKLNLTIIMITHEMEVVKKICSKIAVLEHGEIVEQGSVVDLFAEPKHPTTERFLQNVTHGIPQHFLPRKENSELLRLSFRGESTKLPVISRLIKEHNVEVNILLGSVDVLKGETIGNLVIELSGKPEERDKARAFLREQRVKFHELV